MSWQYAILVMWWRAFTAATASIRRMGERLWLFDHRQLLGHLRGYTPAVSFYDAAVAAPQRLIDIFQELLGARSPAAVERAEAFVTRDLDHGPLADDIEMELRDATKWYATMAAAGRLVEQP